MCRRSERAPSFAVTEGQVLFEAGRKMVAFPKGMSNCL